MTYLFALLTRDGLIEFHEIPTAQFWDFRDSLRETDCVQFDCVVARPGEMERRKAELTERLRCVWNSREAS